MRRINTIGCKRSLTVSRRRRGAVAAATALCLSTIPAVASAQAVDTSPAATAPASSPATTPAETPGEPETTPTTPAGPTLTLQQVVNSALGVNTGLIAARERLEKAGELINQVNAQGRPQIRLDANDTYSTFATGAPSLPSLSIQNPVLPGGNAIPTVIDVGGNFPTGFIGFGGNGAGGGISLTPGEATSSTVGPASPIPAQQNGPAPSRPMPVLPSSHGNTPAKSTTHAEKDMSTAKTVAEAVAIPALAAYIADDHDSGTAADRADAAAPAAESDVAVPDTSEVGNAVTGSSGSSNSTHLNGYAARVSLIQYLDVFGVLPTARKTESDVRDFYALDIDRLSNETALAAKNLYFNALFGQAQVDTLREQVRYATENVAMTNSRFKHGFVSRLDVLTAQTALASAQQALTAAENQRDLAQANLRYLLGADITGSYTLTAPPLPPLDSTVDVPSAIKTALANRPEVRQAQANIDEAKGLVQLSGDALKPAFGIVATGERISTDTQTQPDTYGSIGAMMYFPLDDGGFTRSRVRSAKTDLRTQQLALDQLKLTIGLEVQQSALNIRNAQAQVASARTALDSAEEAVRIADERYKAGLGTFLDNLNALAQLARTRTNLSAAELLYQTSLAQFVRTIGGR